ncbi:MAG: hypothetical protein V3V14_13475 [Saprospiraceae bacterium]
MKNLKILLSITMIIGISLFLHSCLQEVTTENTEPDYFELAQEIMSNYSDQRLPESESRGIEKCFDSEGCFFQGAKTDTILVPGYGNCMAIVNWEQWWCQSSAGATNIVNIHFDQFSAGPLGSGCDSLNQAWFAMFQAGQYGPLEQAIYSFNFAAREEVQRMVMEAFTIQFGVFVNCNTGGVLLSSKFHVATCYKTCAKFIFDKGIPKIVYISSLCGEVCCEVTTAYCWNTLTQSIVTSGETSTQDGICTEDIGHSCPSGFFPLSQHCRSTCR